MVDRPLDNATPEGADEPTHDEGVRSHVQLRSGKSRSGKSRSGKSRVGKSRSALQGAVMLMVAHGLSAAALFIMSGQLYERLHSREFSKMGGLWSRMPWLPPIGLFFAAASLGLPGTANFIGEFLVLAGAWNTAPTVVIVAAAGLVFASVYSLAMIHRSMFGPARSEEPIEGSSPRELAMLLTLVASIVYFGLYPQPVLDLAAGPVARLQQIYTPPAP